MRIDPVTGKVQTHKSLNTLLQSAGAIVMKYAMVILRKDMIKYHIRCTKVLDIHDEGQISCHPDDVPTLRKAMESCLKRAGEFLKMECPLASDSIVGDNWLATH